MCTWLQCIQVDISSGASLITSVVEKTTWILLLFRPIGQFYCHMDKQKDQGVTVFLMQVIFKFLHMKKLSNCSFLISSTNLCYVHINQYQFSIDVSVLRAEKHIKTNKQTDKQKQSKSWHLIRCIIDYVSRGENYLDSVVQANWSVLLPHGQTERSGSYCFTDAGHFQMFAHEKACKLWLPDNQHISMFICTYRPIAI